MKKEEILIYFMITTIIYMFFWNNILISPLRIYLTAIHETFHGLAAIISGGSIYKMSLNHFSGVLTSLGGFYPLISVSGYLGSALLGSILISSENRHVYLALTTIAVTIISILYIDTYFSYEFLGVLSISILLFIVVWKQKFIKEISLFIGTMLAFESIQDIRMYLFVAPEKTDSGLLANYLGLPILTLPISIFLLTISILIWYKIGFKRIVKK